MTRTNTSRKSRHALRTAKHTAAAIAAKFNERIVNFTLGNGGSNSLCPQ